MVPMEGVEPTHPYGYQILSLARLPIPPHRLPLTRYRYTNVLDHRKHPIRGLWNACNLALVCLRRESRGSSSADLRMYNRALGPQDVFHLFEHEQNVQPGSQIRTVMLSFAVSPGATIQFESSPDLRTWAAYGPLIVSTTGIVYQDADLSGVRQYFRVKLVAP